MSQLGAMNLDMEGLTFAEGHFFIVSEVHHKMVKLDQNNLSWVPDLGSVYGSAHNEGLFQVYNAGLEGVSYLGNQTFLLAVEREPRGLIEVVFDDDFVRKQRTELKGL